MTNKPLAKNKHTSGKSLYSLQFVSKIRKSKKKVAEGRFIALDPGKSLWENLER
jgi:hypothetical protein